MPRGAADGLDQRALGAQEPFLVGVENTDERHLGDVESFAQEVDTHQYVELAQPQVADDLDPLDRFDIRVQVAHLDAVLVQVVGQVFGHPLGERGDQHTLAALDADIDLREQIVHLRLRRAHFEHGVDQSRRPHDLFDDLTGVLPLVVGGRGGYENRLRQELFELVEAQRPVVKGGRQPEAVVDEVFLARAVALVHPADLRNRHVRFVDKGERVARHVVDQRRRRLARLAAREMTRVVLDALAESDLEHHLDVEARALLDALGLDQLHLRDEELLLLRELDLDRFDRVEHLVPARDVVARRKHREARELLLDVPG